MIDMTDLLEILDCWKADYGIDHTSSKHGKTSRVINWKTRSEDYKILAEQLLLKGFGYSELKAGGYANKVIEYSIPSKAHTKNWGNWYGSAKRDWLDAVTEVAGTLGVREKIVKADVIEESKSENLDPSQDFSQELGSDIQGNEEGYKKLLSDPMDMSLIKSTPTEYDVDFLKEIGITPEEARGEK